MEYAIEDLREATKQDLSNLEGQGVQVICGNYEPWADMMLLGGAGDPGSDSFPFDIEEIESIKVTIAPSS